MNNKEITEESVVAVSGYGFDRENKQIDIGLSQDDDGNFYFDDQTNTDRIFISDYALMGNSYHTVDNWMVAYQFAFHQDSYLYLNDPIKYFGIIYGKSNQIDNLAAIEAYKHIQKSYCYYKNTFNYDGMSNDFQPHKLRVIVNITMPKMNSVNGQVVSNAFTKDKAILLGKGGTYSFLDPQGNITNLFFENIAYSASLVSHEYAHPIVMFRANSKEWIHNNETYAMIEALPDLLAASQLRKWEIGTDVITTDREKFTVARNLANPSSFYSPSTARPFPEKYSDINLSDKPHTIGTVLGKTYFLVVQGGEFNNKKITGIGFEKAEQVLFLALHYLNKKITGINVKGFSSFRAVFEKACKELYPEVLPSVRDAFDATEIPIE